MLEKYGLDKPLIEQYFVYLGTLSAGISGVSYTRAGITVNKVIADGFPYSLAIGLYSSLIVVFAGIGFGVLCALNQNKFIDRFFMVLSTLGATIPSFVLATGFLFIFSKTLGWVPAFGVDTVAGYIGPDSRYRRILAFLYNAPYPHKPAGGAAAGLYPHRAQQGHIRI